MIKITKAISNFESEPLRHPFGFKGAAVSKIWQYVVYLESDSGMGATGVGCQSVLWSDSAVFAKNSPSASYAMMYLITDYAVQLIKGMSFNMPYDILDEILPKVTEYAKKVTNRKNLRKTFVLNALVGVDHALWNLYARENRFSFDEMIPKSVKPYMNSRYDKIGVIPLISYGVTISEVENLVKDGFFLLKIKIGSDPDRDGDYDKMLQWDKERLLSIHKAVDGAQTPYTESGKIAYYLDANGRYDSPERLKALLDYAGEIGVLDNTVVVEEPFAEENKWKVDVFGANIAADESAHSEEDVIERLGLGYNIIALKPIAKTMSVTFRMIEAVYKKNSHAFCADLTVGPLMVELNKCFASRLPILPGLKLPVVESNGWQNYIHWKMMEKYHPGNGQPWTKLENGIYCLDNGFYEKSGGLLGEYIHYKKLSISE